MGFDSVIGQLIHPLYALPQLVKGEISFGGWSMIYHDQYGKEMHLSAFVIYGLAFWFLSRHYDFKHGVVKSKNVCYAVALTLLSVSLFEFYWMISYAYFQNQWWVITPRWPQIRIILQNVAFLSTGVIGALYMYIDGHIFNKNGDVIRKIYRFNLNKTAWLLIGLSVSSALFWWFYPFNVERFTVSLETGETWTNTNRFPQTLYTIDLNPHDNLNSGVWYWKANDLVHLVNTIVKILWTFTIVYVGKIKHINS